MTPRDHYAAAALQGLLAAETESWNFLDEGNDARDCERTASIAADIAEAMAREACKRWGHLWSEDYKDVYDDVHRIGQRRECHRCGHAQTRTLTEVMPPASSTMMPYDEPGEWKDGAP